MVSENSPGGLPKLICDTRTGPGRGNRKTSARRPGRIGNIVVFSRLAGRSLLGRGREYAILKRAEEEGFLSRESPMKAVEGRPGRVFILRLGQDDVIPKCIEDFAAEKRIRLGQVVFIGGLYQGDLVAGPRRTADPRPDPLVLPVDEACETLAFGVIAPDENGGPRLHMHGALGRAGQTMAGCFQKGVSVWLVGEAVVCEILSAGDARRMVDETAKVRLLEIMN